MGWDIARHWGDPFGLVAVWDGMEEQFCKVCPCGKR